MKKLNPSAAPGGTDQPSGEQLQPATAAPGTLSTRDDSLLGQQLTAQYRKAITATREVVIFGAMMIKIRESLSARGQAQRNQHSEATVNGWLEQFAPEVSRPTAYRFMALAEGVQEEFQLGKKVDLTLLLTESADELTPALRKKQQHILEFLEGKSQRQLLLQLGGDEPKKKTQRKRDEELTPEEEEALVEKALRNEINELMDGIERFTSKKYFHVWNDAELDRAAELLTAALTALDTWRAMPKGKRLATAIQDSIREWKGVK